MCWIQSKCPFTGISCGDCYFVTKPLRSCQYKATEKFMCGSECAYMWVRWVRVSHIVSLLGLMKSPQFATCCAEHIVYTWKQLSLQQQIKSDDVLRVGRCDSSLRSDLFQNSFNIQVQACWNITGKDKAVQQKMWQERMRKKGGGIFFFLNNKKNWRFEIRFTAACTHVMSELKSPCFSERLILNALWD